MGGQAARILRLNLPSEPRFSDVVSGFVTSVWENVLGDKAQKQAHQLEGHLIMLAVHEACINSMVHAYQNDLSRVVEVEAEILPDQIAFSIIDQGISFDYDSVISREISAEPRENGYGLQFIRSIMDEVSYKKDPTRGNILRLSKAL
jgi:anti-sigma regulatory factor (Ser/Thr protein kinase)